jgi:hypothetical protein
LGPNFPRGLAPGVTLSSFNIYSRGLKIPTPGPALARVTLKFKHVRGCTHEMDLAQPHTTGGLPGRLLQYRPPLSHEAVYSDLSRIKKFIKIPSEHSN